MSTSSSGWTEIRNTLSKHGRAGKGWQSKRQQVNQPEIAVSSRLTTILSAGGAVVKIKANVQFIAKSAMHERMHVTVARLVKVASYTTPQEILVSCTQLLVKNTSFGSGSVTTFTWEGANKT